jgi:hypothetical protein
MKPTGAVKAALSDGLSPIYLYDLMAGFRLNFGFHIISLVRPLLGVGRVPRSPPVKFPAERSPDF